MVKAFIKKRYGNDTDGYIVIKIPVTGGRAVEKPMGIKIAAKHWNQKERQVKNSHPDAAIINAQISQEISLINADIQQLSINKKKVTREAAKRIKEAPSDGDAISFMEGYIEEVKRLCKGRDKDAPRYSKSYIKSLNRIKNCAVKFSGHTLPFSDVDYNYMVRLEAFLAEDMNYETTVPSTLAKFIGMMKEASKRGLFKFEQIAEYSPPPYRPPHKDYLTIDELLQIKEHLIGGKLDHSPELKAVAAFFLIECCTGIRYSDWEKYSIEKIAKREALKLITKKTRQPIYMYLDKSPILSEVKKYIEDNRLSYTYTNQHTNRLLKSLGGVVGIKKILTSHVGRHTCATLLLEIGYSKETAAEVLGVSMQTIDIYAKVTRRKLQVEYDRLGGL